MRQKLAVAVIASMMISLAGCGGSDGSSAPTPDPSTSASGPAETSEDPVASASELPTRPRDVDSEEGARDFSIFVMQNIVYASATNDVEPLLALSMGPSCETCTALARAAADRGDVAQVPSGDTTIADITVEKRDADSYVVRQVLEVPEGELKNLKSGDVRKALNASEVKLTAVVVWVDGQWRLENYGDNET